MTELFERDTDGFIEMGDVAHRFGLLPNGCEDRAWLPYLDAGTIGMDPKHKIMVPLPARSPATSVAA